MLNGQKLQGPPTAEEVNYMLKNKGLEDKYVPLCISKLKSYLTKCLYFYICRFPLFTAIHKICTNQLKPKDLIDCIRNHPEHM